MAEKMPIYEAILESIHYFIIHPHQTFDSVLVRDFVPFQACDRTIRRRLNEMVEAGMLRRVKYRAGYCLPG